MFNSGLSTADIAKHYGVSTRTINNHRSRCGVASYTAEKFKGENGNKKQHEEAVNRIKKYLSDSGSTIEYVGGSTRCAIFKCSKCGYEFNRKRSTLLNGCTYCPECKKEQSKALKELAYKKPTQNATCAYCGNVFVYEGNANRKFCTDKCRLKYNKKAGRKSRRNAPTNGSYRPTWRNLYKRGECNCYLCGLPVDPNDYTVTDDGFFIAGNSYPSVDHVLALANGGYDSYENARIAHMKCNGIKRDLPLEVFKCSYQKQSKTVTSLTF